MTELRERTVTIRRTIRAERAFLFAAWINPDLFARWFGPKAWAVDRCEIDARVGGRWRAWFRRGDGGEVYAGGTYLEIAAPEKLVFTWDLDPDGGEPDKLSVVTVSFLGAIDGVEVVISHQKLSTADSVNMDVGWSGTLDSLADFAAAQVHREGDRR